ncbi:MAG: NAD(P)/FAD-dependent oxidoreductase [Deferrisomatales bacterium]
MKRIVIVGGGYGGLACLRAAARRFRGTATELLLLDATPYHTLKTRFHERAVRAERERGLRFRLAPLAAASGARFVQDEVVEVDSGRRRVVGAEGEYPYDAVVLGLGGRTVYFGVPGAEEHTVSLQTYEAADRAARRVRALGLGRRAGPHRRVVVCGAGIEGLEVAAMLRRLAPPRRCAIDVVEMGPDVMARSRCSDAQRRYLRAYLERKEIGLRLRTRIREVGPQGVLLDPGGEVPADLVYWCSGVRRETLGAEDPEGPFTVDRRLRRPDHPEVFALGDFATVDSPEPYANLGSAQRAVCHGGLVGENLWRLARGRPLRPVRYRPAGEIVGLGDTDGVGSLYGVPLRGIAAAMAKKAIEARYLGELFGGVPGAARRCLPGWARQGRAGL